jgi:formylglycine-generating enzyme required for sulfatase activity
MGMTPSMGEGDNQRAAGGPPLPGMGPQGQTNGPSGPLGTPGSPGSPKSAGKGNGAQGNANGGPNFPQHKPKFDLNQPHNGGVGHVRPGSGVPSAPPNMPGSQAKFVGEEQPWTANPSNSMKSKRVTVSSFWMDRTEVTRKAYQQFLINTGYRPPFIAEEWAEDGWNWDGTNYPKNTGDHPVVMVSWYDAQEYCAWQDKRLPTEAEWQLAALGDVRLGNDFPWGKEYNHDALNHGQIESPNFDDSDGYLHTSPVGAFPAGQSAYGLEDTFGNAWEFTADARRATWKFYDKADGSSPKDTMAPGPSLYVGVRGGAYFFDLRPNPGGERNEFLTEVRRKTAGFRCAKS